MLGPPPAAENEPRFSPNGRLVAYISDETGGPEIYVARYENGRLGETIRYRAAPPRRKLRQEDVGRQWDVLPDGRLIAIQKGAQKKSSRGMPLT
jgi:Tol biopolymer transport system component